MLREVKSFRAQAIESKRRLERAQKAQVQVVADKAAQRSSIEGQLAERQRLLSSIKDQIASLQAAEQRRQERAGSRGAGALPAPRQNQSAEAAPEALIQSDSVEEAIAPPPDARYGGVVGIAMQYLGTPYVWGGAEPGRLRLLRVRLVRLRPDGRLAPASRRLAVRDGLSGLARPAPGRATSSSSTGSATSASTSAAASSSMRRTPATWSRSPASTTPGTRVPGWAGAGSSARARGGARAPLRGPCRGRSASG